MAPKAKPKAKAEPKAAVAKAAPKAKAEPKAAPKAKAEPVAKAAAKAKAAPGSPAAGSGAAAVRQNRIDAKAGAKAAPAKDGAAAAAAAAAKAEEEAKLAAEEEERKAKEAEEHKRFEEMQKLEIQRKAEEEAKRKEKENGDVVLKYNMYAEKFPIKGGQIKAADIDEVYCLSDVMPGCVIHLSAKSVEEKYAIDSAGETFPYIFEEPAGTFHGLEADSTYFVYVTEDEEEFLKSQAKAKLAFAGVTQAAARLCESCSCLEGNPCVDSSVCTDWHNRFALAKKNGWIGYQAF